MQIIEIEDEEVNKFIFGEAQKIKVKRKGLIDEDEELEILGKQFEPDDIFIGYV